MPGAWIPGFILTLLFGLLSSLQRVSANKVMRCIFLSCLRGFRYSDSECCREKKMWDPSNDPFRILIIIFAVMLPLLCFCGVVRRICRACRPQQSLRTNDETPPEPPSSVPLETMIWVTNLDPPPPYNQVVPKSTPTEEPPPPYSLEDPLGQMRNTTFF
uniref:transmembrane protein 92 n=1 Tax=Myodes glareolus TaxID=447135 RepID=UPI0020204E7D|nr:transmembrane protein 92 [Myodes glareolus]